MTPLRQVFHSGLVAAVLAVALPSSAEPLAVIGPPTAADAAALAAAEAPPAPPVAAPVATPGAKPGWLASRPAATPKAVAGRSSLPSLGRIIGLFLVVGSLGGAALYLKRRGPQPGKRVAPSPRQRLSVVSSTRIGPKAHAVVISVAGRQMLLGVTDASVKRLAFIDEVEDEEAEREPTRRPGPQKTAARSTGLPVRTAALEIPMNPSFGGMLKAAFKKRDREPEPEADAASILAAETHDVVAGKPVTSNVRMLDVEGQAQGLIRRLSGPRA